MRSINLFKIISFIFSCIILLNSCTKIDNNTNNGNGHGNNDGNNPNGTAARVIMDTAYGNHPQQIMDIYLPANRTSNTKLIVLIHGGAWSGGDKSEMNVLIPLIQSQWPSCAIVNLNYRLANGTTVIADTIMQDIIQSIGFMAQNKNAFVISSDMGMIGASAGAQLALLYTYKYNIHNYVKAVSSLYAPSVINDWEWYNSTNIFLGQSIKNILTNYVGTTWNTERYEACSPYTQLSATQQKPTIIFHGTLDVIVPLYQSQWLNAKLTTLNVDHEYYEYFDIHGFNTSNNADCMLKTTTFFKTRL
jgi:acetyl esterase/lipase